MTKRVLYIADPMCSWCWGFSPVIAEIAHALGARAPVRLIVGGLRPGERRPMDARAKAYLRHHWRQVQASTGQPFDFAFFDRQEFVYDTEPACRAAVAVRSLAPDATLSYLAAVQHAFYAENQDVTREAVLAEVGEAIGLPREAFTTVYRAPEVAEATRADFALAPALGISGFPSVLLQDDRQLTLLTAGWQPFASLQPALLAWLDE